MSVGGMSRNEKGQKMKLFQFMLREPDKGCIVSIGSYAFTHGDGVKTS